MHPILSQLRILPWYLLVWGCAGVILAWVLVMTQAAHWSAAVVFALPALLLYGFIVTSAYYVCRALPLVERTAQRVLMTFGGASLVSASIWMCLCLLLNNLSLYFGVSGIGVFMTPQFQVALFVIASLLYLL
jgi:two-component system sensor histidine kinase AlgZ